MDSKEKNIEERIKKLEDRNKFNEDFIKEVIDGHNKEITEVDNHIDRIQTFIARWVETIRNHLWYMRIYFYVVVLLTSLQVLIICPMCIVFLIRTFYGY